MPERDPLSKFLVQEPAETDEDQEAPVTSQQSPLIEAEVPSPAPAPEPEPAIDDPLGKFLVGEPPSTLGEKGVAAGRGFVSGATRMAALTSGAVAGFQLGAAGGTAVAPGPGTVVGALTGTLVGGAAGLIAGEGMVQLGQMVNFPFSDEPLTMVGLESLPEDQRAYAAGGETFGGALIPGAAVVKIARGGARVTVPAITGTRANKVKRFAGSLMNGMLDYAAARSKRFLAIEAMAAAQSGVAGGVATEVAPERPGVRLAAELAAPLPTQVIAALAPGVYRTVANAVRSLSPAGRQTVAGKRLLSMLEVVGEDPDAWRQALLATEAEGLPPGAKPTVAQRLGTPGADIIEAELREINRELGTDASRLRDETLRGIAQVIVDLRGTGDPQALLEAARIRNTYYEALFNGRIAAAKEEAARSVEAITQDTAADMVELAKATEEAMGSAMRAGRAMERVVWAPVDNQIATDFTSIFKRFSALRGEMLESQDIHPVIEGEMKIWRAARDTVTRARKAGFDSTEKLKALERATKRGPQASRDAARATLTQLGISSKKLEKAIGKFTSGELIKFRKVALELAREADTANDRRMFSGLAEAALDDLSHGFERAVQQGVLTPAQAQVYDDARAYSFQFNNVFTRTFVGDALALDNTGANRISPELLLERAVASGKTLANLRLRELEEATRFVEERLAQELDVTVSGEVLTPKGLADAQADVDLMMDAQARLIRVMAIATTKAETGRVSTESLAKFIRDHELLLDRFPEVKIVLDRALKSEQDLKELQRVITYDREGNLIMPKWVLEREAFAAVLGVDSPADAVKAALREAEPQPLQKIKQLVELARTKGPAAVQGLRASIWDNAIRNATPGDDVLLKLLAREITQPIRPGLPSLLDIMHAERLMTKADVAIVKRAVNRAVQIGETAATLPTGKQILGGGLLDVPEMALDVALSIGGAKLGSRAARSADAGQGLIAAQKGSAVIRQMLSRIPKRIVQEIIVGAFRGDKMPGSDQSYGLMITLLETPQTVKEGFKIALQIHGYALMAGLIAADEPVLNRLGVVGAEAELAEDAKPAQVETAEPAQVEAAEVVEGPTSAPAVEESEVTPSVVQRAVGGIKSLFSNPRKEEN